MEQFILKENVLSDNTLSIPDYGKVFKGGYVGIIEEYSFQNSWSDKKTIKRFRSEKRLNDYLNKKYPNIEIY